MSEIKPDGESQNLAVIAERIRSRRTTKLFLKQKVSRKLVLAAIEVARWAPNHHLTEPLALLHDGAGDDRSQHRTDRHPD